VDLLGLKWGWNVVGSAALGGFASIGDSLLSIVTLNRYGMAPVSQANLYGGATLAKYTKISLYTGVGSLGAAVAIGLAAPALGATSLSPLPAALASESGMALTVGGMIAAAEERYPKLVGISHWHHVIPRYIGGLNNWIQVHIPAAYHQLLTNEFRRLWPYGKGRPPAERAAEIVQEVLSKYPLDCFPRR